MTVKSDNLRPGFKAGVSHGKTLGFIEGYEKGHKDGFRVGRELPLMRASQDAMTTLARRIRTCRRELDYPAIATVQAQLHSLIEEVDFIAASAAGAAGADQQTD